MKSVRQRVLEELQKGEASQHELSERLGVARDVVAGAVFLETYEAQEAKRPGRVIGAPDGKKLQLNPEISLGNGKVPSR